MAYELWKVLSVIALLLSWPNNISGTLAGKLSATSLTIKLDFPVPRSPVTTILTLIRFLELAATSFVSFLFAGCYLLISLFSCLCSSRSAIVCLHCCCTKLLIDSFTTTLRNCRCPKGSSTGTFSFTLKTQLIFLIFKYILFDCFRFQFI